MEHNQSAADPARRPIPSIFIGALLLLISGSLFFIDILNPAALREIESLQGFSPLTLFVTLLAGGYLLACLVPSLPRRVLLQRLTAALLIATSLSLLLTKQAPPNASLPSSDALLAFILAGVAALLNPSVRSLSHVAICFLLILLATALAILGLTILVLGYDPFLFWSGAHAMNSHTAISLLLFCAGLAYTIWWSQRRKEFDPVAGITLLASTLLIFSLFIGAVLFYAVTAAYLHFEIHDDLRTLLKERAARVGDTLHHARTTTAMLAYEAEQREGNLWTQHLVDDYALRITDKQGRLIQQHNAAWFAQNTTLSLASGNTTTLWRGEQGHCQLRTTLHRAKVDIEIGVPVNLMEIMTSSPYHTQDEQVLLCGRESDGTLRCLSAAGASVPPPAMLLQSKSSGEGDGVQFHQLHDNIEATIQLADFGLIAYMEKSHQQIFAPLYNKLLLTLPLALLLLIASIALLAWRIQPMARRLQNNEQRYHSLVDGAADAIFLHAPNRRFIEANPAAVKLLGYEHHELLGMHPDDFLLHEDRDDAREQLEQMKRDGALIHTRRLLRRKDGSQIPVEIRATRLDSGQLISIVRDISEQQQHEESLRERERFIRSVFEVLAEGVMVYGEEGEVIFTNQSAQRILGAQTLPQPPYRSFIYEDGSPIPPSHHPVILSLHHGLSKRGVIMGVVRTGGVCIWISVNSDPLWDKEHNRLIGSVVSFSDITNNRLTEQALHQSREQLRALSSHLLQVREEEKKAIAREIHDELGANLSAIKLSVEWLNGQLQAPSPEVHDRLTHLLRITAHTIKSARSLVTQLRPTIVEDLGLWSALEWLLREFEQNTGIETSHRMQAHHLELPQQTALILYRVVQEALNNIAKHAHAHKVHLECWHNGGILYLAIEDDGIGLSEETTFNVSSYGIRGMYERIEQLQGTLQFLGSPGEGTLIAITIPYSAPEEEQGTYD